jgi:tetratricopeptide (TPR) repeat protein
MTLLKKIFNGLTGDNGPLQAETTARNFELNRKAERLLGDHRSGVDAKGLVRLEELWSDLTSLAEDIKDYEKTKGRKRPLSPACQFVRGLNFHLTEHFDEALATWDLVIRPADASEPLKILAWYWKGLEHNDLGKFQDAEHDFSQALRLAQAQALRSAPGQPLRLALDLQIYELKRIRIETKFFKNGRGGATACEGAIKELATEIDGDANPDKGPYMTRIYTTYGNILLVAGTETKNRALYEDARKKFQKVANWHDPQNWNWATFGLAQALWDLEDDSEAKRIFKAFAPIARQAFLDRRENRTQVMALTSRLICCTLADEPILAGSVAGTLGATLGAVKEAAVRLFTIPETQCVEETILGRT